MSIRERLQEAGQGYIQASMAEGEARLHVRRAHKKLQEIPPIPG